MLPNLHHYTYLLVSVNFIKWSCPNSLASSGVYGSHFKQVREDFDCCLDDIVTSLLNCRTTHTQLTAVIRVKKGNMRFQFM